MICGKQFSLTVNEFAPPVLTISDVPFAPELSWTQTNTPTTNAIWRNQNNAGYALLATQAGALLFYNELDSLIAGDYWCYKIIPSEGLTSNEACASRDFLLLGVTPSYPTLVVEYGNLQFNDVTNITSFDLSGLKYVLGTVFVDASTSLTSAISFPSLLRIDGDFDAAITNSPTISMPLCMSLGGDFSCDSSPNLTTISIPQLIFTNGTNIHCEACALSATAIENVAARLVASAVTTCDIHFEGGTNAALASLSPAGQANIATLIANGNTVTTN